MILDNVELIGDTSELTVDLVTTLPSGEEGQMVFLTAQDGDNAVGTYVHNGTTWRRLRMDGESSGWWDDNAIFVVDGSIGTVGQADITSPIAGYTFTPDSGAEFTTEETRSGDKSLKLSDPSSSKVGLVRYTRDGATTALIGGSSSFTIEHVTKTDGTNYSYRFYSFLNYKMVNQNLNDRSVIATRSTGSAYKLSAWLNQGNPVDIGNSAYGVTYSDWIHEAITYDQPTNTWKHYVDGVLKATKVLGFPAATLQEEYFGAFSSIVYLDRMQIVPGVKYTSNFTPEI